MGKHRSYVIMTKKNYYVIKCVVFFLKLTYSMAVATRLPIQSPLYA